MKKNNTFVVLDLETTGLDPKKDKIIEVALVKFNSENYEIIEEYSTLIDPEIPIPSLNSSITWIYDADVRNAPKWKDVLHTVSEFIWEYPLIWHNVAFDIGFLEEKWVSADDHMIFDTFVLANFLILWEKSLSLEYLCKLLKIELSWAHRALNDTKATLLLFQALIEKLEKLPKYKKQLLSYIFAKSDDEWMRYLWDVYFGDIEKLKDEEEFLKVAEKFLPKHKKQLKIHTSENKGDFDFWKIIDAKKENEKRENQEKMAGLVYETLTDQKFSIIEAPTWVWKTFAYIIPSIFHSLQTWEQVFVSTSTKALQDQIFYKDLKNLQEEYGIDFSYSKLKGKRNYIWVSSFFSFIDQDTSYAISKTSFIAKIFLWLSVTANGELDELEYYGQEFSFLYEINADDMHTFSTENEYIDNEFAVYARRQAKKTNVVIINNNILFQDLDREGSILSKVENLIVDEAHNFEDVLTQSLQKSFSLDELEKSFLKLEKKLLTEEVRLPILSLTREKIIFELSTIFDIYWLFLRRKVHQDSKYKTHLITKDFFSNEWQSIVENSILQKVQILFMEYLDVLQWIDDKVYNKVTRESSYIEMCLDILWKCLLEKADEKYICFLNETPYRWLCLEYTLLHPWEYLKQNLWWKLSSCVLTSATLKSWDDYSYIEKMLSLDNFSWHTLETDFNYKEQALLFTPSDLWSIKNNMPSVLAFLYKFMLLVKWNTLFLCTSFFVIKSVFEWIEQDLKKEWINVYAQSIGGWKKKLIDFYEENSNNSLLVWTNTFWEWVDIWGDSLQYLIIHKIPFMVPSDPIFQARSSLFQDSFSDYALPKAILKLKQWFGRLIRTKNDTWIVIFLDDRIHSTGWWNVVYNAFPGDMKKKTWTTDDFLELLKSRIQ